MNITCDNASVCGSVYRDMGDLHTTQEWARAKGWHLWVGTTMSGQDSAATLCPGCVGAHRRRLPPAPRAEGEQLELDL